MSDTIVIKGADVAASINASIKLSLEEMKLASAPKLAIFRVGSQPDDLRYEKGIIKRFSDLGLRSEVFEFPGDIDNDSFAAAVKRANTDDDISGILIFRPLPAQINDRGITEIINPAKDIDGISPINMAKVFSADPTGFAPCTAVAVIATLDHAGIKIEGSEVTVVGRSLVVGKPLSMLLLNRNATVTICHSRTRDLPAVCGKAQILVSCIGRAKMLNADYAPPGAVVIDVGINFDENGKLCGDVDYDAVAPLVGSITPVPGGVGSVTTSILASNLVKAASQAGTR